MATLIIYSDGSIDARLASSSAISWADALAGATIDVSDGSPRELATARYQGGTSFRSAEGFFYFDTSSIGGAQITSATLSFYYNFAGTFTDTPFDLEARVYDFGASVDITDYRNGSQLSALSLVAKKPLSIVAVGM